MNKLPKYFTRAAPAVIWAGMIFMLSSLPDLGGPDSALIVVATYVVHFFLFAVLGITLYFAFTGKLLPSKESPIDDPDVLAPWVIAVVYAVLDEIHQGFVPGREVSIFDFVTDSAGVLFALILLPLIVKWLTNTFQNLKKTQ